MSTVPNRPALLGAYETAIAEFQSVSHALTSALVDHNPPDYDFQALVASEEKAREAVVIARMRLIGLWRDSDDGEARSITRLE